MSHRGFLPGIRAPLTMGTCQTTAPPGPHRTTPFTRTATSPTRSYVHELAAAGKQLAHEANVVWLENLDELDHVRQALDKSSRA
ncbi:MULTISPECIES: DUF6009 family protein [Streptomyces]|uniref:DUF6009 family protein n=1 Tax=[Kitasatospora] papulosa TaxID=1464011 RepID=UPI0036C3C632